MIWWIELYWWTDTSQYPECWGLRHYPHTLSSESERRFFLLHLQQWGCPWSRGWWTSSHDPQDQSYLYLWGMRIFNYVYQFNSRSFTYRRSVTARSGFPSLVPGVLQQSRVIMIFLAFSLRSSTFIWWTEDGLLAYPVPRTHSPSGSWASRASPSIPLSLARILRLYFPWPDIEG